MFLLLLIAAIALFYVYSTWTFNYWKGRNVKGPRPFPLFGNIKDVVLLRIFPAGCHQIIYREFETEKLVGIYQLRRPSLLLRDPELIKHVLVKDFDHFVDRGFHTDEKREPLTAHLVNLEGNRWRQLRSKLTPAFSSGKIKMMFHLLMECTDNLTTYIESQLLKDSRELEIREVTARFTTDVIGSVAFGLQFDSLSGDSAFREMGKRVMQPTMKTALARATRSFLPWMFDLLKMRTFPEEINSFFIRVVKDTMDLRESTGNRRSDFLQLMIQLKNADIDPNPSSNSLEFTESVIAAQAFIFFIAGFETSSTTLSFCLYEMALNPSLQEKAYREITEVSKKVGSLTYETVSEMMYLELLLLETMRKYPPIANLSRMCNKQYEMPGSGVIVEPGVSIVIPVYALHHDPKYYPEPESFKPERFLDKTILKNKWYLPFGDGPRICIGMRFAMLEMKLALIRLLSNYQFSASSRTTVPLQMDPRTFVTAPIGGIWLKVSSRN